MKLSEINKVEDAADLLRALFDRLARLADPRTDDEELEDLITDFGISILHSPEKREVFHELAEVFRNVSNRRTDCGQRREHEEVVKAADQALQAVSNLAGWADTQFVSLEDEELAKGANKAYQVARYRFDVK